MPIITNLIKEACHGYYVETVYFQFQYQNKDIK